MDAPTLNNLWEAPKLGLGSGRRPSWDSGLEAPRGPLEGWEACGRTWGLGLGFVFNDLGLGFRVYMEVQGLRNYLQRGFSPHLFSKWLSKGYPKYK